MSQFEISQHQNFSRIAYRAMANQCEILIRSLDTILCEKLAQLAFNETQRIENKYSRYIKSNLVDQMNKSAGKKVAIDEETFLLLEYARELFESSEGLFDISSGVLRKVWNFTDHAKPPSKQQVAAQLKHIGFNKIDYDQNSFYMNKGMEIDLGGLVKEYAVDQVAQSIFTECEAIECSFLVNFGGDISAQKLANDSQPWTVGVESVGCHDDLTGNEWPNSFLTISQGAVATSGNTKRFIAHNGKRYGHIMNPKTGYPVENSPLSITTFAENCVMAGSFSSLAMLMGSQAEMFLDEQSVKHLCIW